MFTRKQSPSLLYCVVSLEIGHHHLLPLRRQLLGVALVIVRHTVFLLATSRSALYVADGGGLLDRLGHLLLCGDALDLRHMGVTPLDSVAYLLPAILPSLLNTESVGGICFPYPHVGVVTSRENESSIGTEGDAVDTLHSLGVVDIPAASCGGLEHTQRAVIAP